jgi:hypothetical protein
MTTPEPINPKTRALLDDIQKKLSAALKPFVFETNNEETRRRIIETTVKLLNDLIEPLAAEDALEVIADHFDEEDGVLYVKIRGPRELLEKFRAAHAELDHVDDYRLRFELPDGTVWEDA